MLSYAGMQHPSSVALILIRSVVVCRCNSGLGALPCCKSGRLATTVQLHAFALRRCSSGLGVSLYCKSWSFCRWHMWEQHQLFTATLIGPPPCPHLFHRWCVPTLIDCFVCDLYTSHPRFSVPGQGCDHAVPLPSLPRPLSFGNSSSFSLVVQLVLDLMSRKLALFLMTHAAAETSFYLSVVGHTLPVALLRSHAWSKCLSVAGYTLLVTIARGRTSLVAVARVGVEECRVGDGCKGAALIKGDANECAAQNWLFIWRKGVLAGLSGIMVKGSCVCPCSLGAVQHAVECACRLYGQVCPIGQAHQISQSCHCLSSTQQGLQGRQSQKATFLFTMCMRVYLSFRRQAYAEYLLLFGKSSEGCKDSSSEGGCKENGSAGECDGHQLLELLLWMSYLEPLREWVCWKTLKMSFLEAAVTNVSF
eukprot:scaffold79037_cov19-Tisochrysis_lutea.AAC.2